MNDDVEFNPETEDDDIDFEAGADLEDVLDAPGSNGRRGRIGRRGRKLLGSAAEFGRERLHDAADRGRGGLADLLDDAAEALDNRLLHGADYLRATDIAVMRDDLVAHVKKRPFLSAGIAIGAGYLIGRALGGGSSRKGSNSVGKQIRRAVVSGLGALVVARVRDSMTPTAERDRDEMY